jgi:branched-chain amino acid transport system permease protein
VSFFNTNQVLIQQMLVIAGLGLSQYFTLKVGVFSLATVGYGALGAYGAGLLVTKDHAGLTEALLLAGGIGAVAGGVLGVPLARVRGIFQAVATVGFVLVLYGLIIDATSITGGPDGLIAIPRLANTRELGIFVCVITALLLWLNFSRWGAMYEAVRQDEAAAVAVGVNVGRYHLFAHVVSGAIAGVVGGFLALLQFAITPENFNFNVLVNVLAAVVIGGVTGPVGAVVGAFFIRLLPQIAEPLAQNDQLVIGALLILVVVLLPDGIVGAAIRLVRFVGGGVRARTLAPPSAAAVAIVDPEAETLSDGG